MLTDHRFTGARCESARHDDCNKISGESATVACTRIVNDSGESDGERAAAYMNRGIAWFVTGDYYRALADLDEAIRLNPKIARAYNNRGNIWSGRRDYARALAEYMKQSGLIRTMPSLTATAAMRTSTKVTSTKRRLTSCASTN